MHTTTQTRPPPKAGRRLVSPEELRERFGISYHRSQLFRLARDGRFPRPVKLGPGKFARKAWFEDDIVAWLDGLAAQQGGTDHAP